MAFLFRRKLLLVVAALLFSLDVYAVGLGKLRVQSALDQPLQAEIELLSVNQAEFNTLNVGLASRSEFTRAGVESGLRELESAFGTARVTRRRQ